MATMSNQVFDIAELLEVILLELSQRDVLLSQRVCRFWSTTINGSVKLQRLLCFLAVKAPKDTGNPGITPTILG